MRVVLIQVPLGRNSPDPGPVLPLGIRAIAGSLRLRGHEVHLVDLNLSGALVDLEKLAEAGSFDLIGVSLRNIDTTSRRRFRYYYLELEPTLKLCRKLFGDVPITIGGAGFSLFARQIMERHATCDFGVYLEGEETACELLEHLDDPSVVRGLYRLFAVRWMSYSPGYVLWDDCGNRM